MSSTSDETHWHGNERASANDRAPPHSTAIPQSDWEITQQESCNTTVHWTVNGNGIQLRSSKAKHDFVPIGEAAMTIQGTNVVRSLHVPTSVLCAIIVFIKKAIHTHLKPVYVDWRDVDAFGNLSHLMDTHVTHDSDGIAHQTQRCVYKKTGRVRLMQHNGAGFEEVCARVVEQDAQWRNHVPKMVAEYCGQDHNKAFMLEVRQEYDWFEIVEDCGKFKKSVLCTLGETIAHNFDGEPYWPKKLINKLFSKSVVTRLVGEDRSWRKGVDEAKVASQQSGFITYILEDRQRLLGATIWSKIDLSFLYGMWNCKCKIPDKHGCKSHDDGIPLSRTLLRNFLKNHDLDVFRRTQCSFRPWTFPSNRSSTPKHLALSKDIVMPILYDDGRKREGREREDVKDSPDYIGVGTFGIVFSVRIHGDSHEFSSNKDEKFALKRLQIVQQSTNEGERESEVLRKIALLPHPHITPFHASWTQNRQSHILFPKANSNLSDWLRDQSPPDLDKVNVEHILEQLEGLAAGVGHIHNVGRVGLGRQQAELDKLHAGYHHDLKPANILVFGKVWKISDFGAAKIQQLMSGKSNVDTPYTRSLPDGDTVYGGPDHRVSKHVGPLYDIWSLGCIFLEVLLWLSTNIHNTIDTQSVNPTDKYLVLDPAPRTSEEFVHILDKFAKDRAREMTDKCECSSSASEEDLPTTHSRERLRDEDVSRGEASSARSTGSPNFWYQCAKKKCHLKEEVENRLDIVRKFCDGQSDIFSKLFFIVRQMLCIKPEDRPTASVVVDRIGSLRVHARFNFQQGRVRGTSISSCTQNGAASSFGIVVECLSQQGDAQYTDDRHNKSRDYNQQQLCPPSHYDGSWKKRKRPLLEARDDNMWMGTSAPHDDLAYTGAITQEQRQSGTIDRNDSNRPVNGISDHDTPQRDENRVARSERDVLSEFGPNLSLPASPRDQSPESDHVIQGKKARLAGP